jgi:hypothetical protein
MCTDSFHLIVSYRFVWLPVGANGALFVSLSTPDGFLSLPSPSTEDGHSQGSQRGSFAATHKHGWLHNHDKTHISLSLTGGLDGFPLPSHGSLGASETGTGTNVGTTHRAPLQVTHCNGGARMYIGASNLQGFPPLTGEKGAARPLRDVHTMADAILGGSIYLELEGGMDEEG